MLPPVCLGGACKSDFCWAEIFYLWKCNFSGNKMLLFIVNDVTLLLKWMFYHPHPGKMFKICTCVFLWTKLCNLNTQMPGKENLHICTLSVEGAALFRPHIETTYWGASSDHVCCAFRFESALVFMFIFISFLLHDISLSYCRKAYSLN